MAFLPCHDGRGCRAPCCISLAVWDSWSYNRLLRDFPGILDEKNAGSVLVAGAQNHFVVVPRCASFDSLIGSTIGSAEFIKLVGRFEETRRIEDEELSCVFMDDFRRCEVYEYRPRVCQNFGVVPEMPCPRQKEFHS